MLSSYILRMADVGDETAFIEQGVYRSRSATYAQVVERSLAFSRWLQNQGLAAATSASEATVEGGGPRVILWAPASARWAEAFYGCVLAGAVVVPVDAGFSPEFVARVAGHTRACLLVTDEATVGRWPSSSMARLETRRLLTREIDSLPAAPREPAPLPSPPGEALAEIVYTSGTTAEPRGVMITHGNLLANLEPVEREIQRYRHLAVAFRPLRFIHLIPLSHLFGQVMGLFVPQLLRGVVIFPESQAPGELARIIRERRVSAMVCVPQQIEAMGQWALAQLNLRPKDGRGAGIGEIRRKAESIEHSQMMADLAAAERLPFWRRWWKFRRLHQALGWKMWAFVVGGAELAARVERLWNALGYAVVQGYGLTETAPAISITHPFKIRQGSVGRLLAGAEVRIAPDGEILVRGPNVSPGYYRNEAATRESFADGWLHTGDLGQFDGERNLIYLGRKKEVIVTAEGLNVYPEDVEQALLAQPAVREAAVVGREAGADSASGRTLVHAVLVPQPGAGTAEIEEAVAQANQRLEQHQRIRSYSVWPHAALPRTLSTHKLQRTAIAAWVNRQESGQATGGAPASLPGGAAPPGQAADWRSFLARLGVSPERLEPNARLSEDLGLSSLDRVELLTWLETQGCPVDEERLTRALTVRELEEAICGEPSAAPARGAEAAFKGKAIEATSGVPIPARTAVERPPRALGPARWPRWWLVSASRSVWRALVLFPILRWYVKLEAVGTEKLAALSPPVLFVANHQSVLDVPTILRGLPARFRISLAPAIGADTLRPLRWMQLWREPTVRVQGERLSRVLLFLARFLFNGYLLTDDPSDVHAALRHAGKLADEGNSTLLFPEGERTPDGTLQRFRPGVGVMAERLQLPVIPLRLEGLFEILPRSRAGPHRGRARLSVGDPLFIQPGETAAQFTARLESYYRAWV